MTRRLARVAVWTAAAALVVLVARSLAYALAAPSPLASALRHSAGGARVPTVTLALLGICAAVAVAVVWLASMGVRERAALSATPAPRLRPLRILAHTLGLMLVSSLAFAAFESYLHLRAGLGWHGLSCLTGPVHVAALPLLAGFSALAAAAIESGRHVLAWLRRTILPLLERATRATPPSCLVPSRAGPAPVRLTFATAQPRAPPVSA